MWKFFKNYTLDTPCDTKLKWLPRIETSGFNPSAHGWTVNSGTTLLAFGEGSKTDANKNIYHSLQLTTGQYMLSFRAEGAAGKTVGVKMQRYQTNAVVLDETVEVGKDVTLLFNIENDAFGEYKITFTRQNTSDNITISNIVLKLVDVVLDNDADNTTAIDTHVRDTGNVAINGRTLYKDNAWNTLCLPFNVTVSGSVLDGATVKTTNNVMRGDIFLLCSDGVSDEIDDESLVEMLLARGSCSEKMNRMATFCDTADDNATAIILEVCDVEMDEDEQPYDFTNEVVPMEEKTVNVSLWSRIKQLFNQ